MFPDTAVNNAAAPPTKTSLGKSFLFDFSKGDFAVEDGKVVTIDGKASIKVWIEKILRTEKGHFEIYDGTDYGAVLEDLIIGENYQAAFVESELRREIEDAILKHPQISGIQNFNITRNADKITASLEVELIDEGTDTIKVIV